MSTARLPWLLRPVEGPVACKLPLDRGESATWLREFHGSRAGTPLRPDARDVWPIARDRARPLAEKLAEQFGQVDVFLDYRTADACDRRCHEASDDDCVCSCLGRYHGGAQFWRRWREIEAVALVHAGKVHRRHILVTRRNSPAGTAPAAGAATGSTPPTQLWLDVPFADKDEAKQFGARWDGQAKRWYAPGPEVAALARWMAKPPVPELLPGEDRNLGNGLFVDLVPSSCWFTNVRYCVVPADWERLRRMITTRAGNRCEACRAEPDPAAKVWLEAHERWTFDSATRVQRLGRLICLCTPCHTVTHYGLATVRGRDREAFGHLVAVTGMTDAQARRHIDEAFRLWATRSTVTWSLDLSILTDAGITLAPPPAAESRATIAETTLTAERGPARFPWGP